MGPAPAEEGVDVEQHRAQALGEGTTPAAPLPGAGIVWQVPDRLLRLLQLPATSCYDSTEPIAGRPAVKGVAPLGRNDSPAPRANSSGPAMKANAVRTSSRFSGLSRTNALSICVHRSRW